MIKAIIADYEAKAVSVLEERIRMFCPEVKVFGIATTIDDAAALIKEKQPDLVFLEIDLPPSGNGFELLRKFSPRGFEVLVTTHLSSLHVQDLIFCISGLLLKPVEGKDLIAAVAEVRNRIGAKEEYRRNKALIRKSYPSNAQEERFGIPTLKGIDFFYLDEIIRCEGLQRCTRIVVQDKSNIVSSYNLGAFRKVLEPLGFFSSHRSHLINLTHVKHYNKEGTITMIDGSHVPVAKRKKSEFLNSIRHL